MKHLKKIAFIIYSGIALFSCNLMDKSPIDTITEDDVWNDEVLTNLYISDVYSSMDYLYRDGVKELYEVNMVSHLSDESRDGYSHKVTTLYKPGLYLSNQSPLKCWDYSTVRKINEFFERIDNTPFDEDVKNKYKGRMHFARAFIYFSMAKRYGGVPIILRTQDMDEPDEDLYVERSTEKATYDYIISELDKGLAFLPDEVYDSAWPTRYAALALKSRAALYAASIATYGSVDLDGLVGIPDEDAGYYWEIAREAAFEIIDSDKFKLYEKYPSDKVENYRKLFLDEDGNTEVIFSKRFTGINEIYHNWDAYEFPNQFSGGNNAGVTNVYLEMVDSYENIDGTTTKLQEMDLTKAYDLQTELFKDKDPRFHASLFFEGSIWQGQKLENWSSLIKPDGKKITTGNYEGIGAIGTNYSLAKKVQVTSTGFNVKKYCDDSMDRPVANTSRSDYIVFRYGEVFLNYAEALLELEKLGQSVKGFEDLTAEALIYVNQIRNRAGIKELTKDELTIDRLRNERKIELAFENHRYWDLRRWRIAVTELNKKFSGISTSFDYESFNSETDTKKFKVSIVKDIDPQATPSSFENKHYYLPLGYTNKAVKENPGWTK